MIRFMTNRIKAALFFQILKKMIFHKFTKRINLKIFKSSFRMLLKILINSKKILIIK